MNPPPLRYKQTGKKNPGIRITERKPGFIPSSDQSLFCFSFFSSRSLSSFYEFDETHRATIAFTGRCVDDACVTAGTGSVADSEVIKEFFEDRFFRLCFVRRSIDFEFSVCQSAAIVATLLCERDETFDKAAEFFCADDSRFNTVMFDQAASQIDEHGFTMTAIAVQFCSMFEVSHCN